MTPPTPRDQMARMITGYWVSQMLRQLVGSSFRKAITGIGALGRLHLGRDRLGVSTDDTVTFHAVGDREPISRKLVELDRIVLG